MSHFTLRTEDFAPRHRVSEFETVAANICKLAIAPTGADYTSATSIAVLPDLVIADTTHSPCRTRRTGALAAKTGDNLLLHIPLSGGFTIRQDRGDEAVCSPGQIYLDPSEVPGLACFMPAESRVLYVSIPRAALMAACPGLNPGLRRMVSDTPQWRMLIAYARAVHAEAAALPPDHLETSAAHLRDLAVLALGADRAAMQAAAAGGGQAARLRAIKADIETHLVSADLTPGWIAARHGISTRYLRSLFAQDHTSFSDHVALRRLMRVRRQLTDPRHAGQSIARLALDAGFGDVSWFNKRFRDSFGLTPSEARAQARANGFR